MSGYTLDRKLSAPVACTACVWNGKVGDLITRREPDGSPFRCPACDCGWCILWIEAPSTEVLQ